MVYKFLNEYLAKLSMLTGTQGNEVEEEDPPSSKAVIDEKKISPRSSMSSIFDFNDIQKIEKQIMI